MEFIFTGIRTRGSHISVFLRRYPSIRKIVQSIHTLDNLSYTRMWSTLHKGFDVLSIRLHLWYSNENNGEDNLSDMFLY